MQVSEKSAIGFVFGVLLLGLVVVLSTRDTHEVPQRDLAAVDPAALPAVVTISHGEAVDLAPYLVDGTQTLVEFTAEW